MTGRRSNSWNLLRTPTEGEQSLLVAVLQRTMAVISVAPLLALRVLLYCDRFMRFAVRTRLRVRLTFSMTAAGMRRRRATIDAMLTELTGRQLRRFLLGGGE